MEENILRKTRWLTVISVDKEMVVCSENVVGENKEIKICRDSFRLSSSFEPGDVIKIEMHGILFTKTEMERQKKAIELAFSFSETESKGQLDHILDTESFPTKTECIRKFTDTDGNK